MNPIDQLHSFIKTYVKKQLGRICHFSGVYRFAMTGKAIIVVFHSISDNADGNPIASSPEKFEQFCRYFQKHFHVISMNELVERLMGGKDISYNLVITFDDGYRDNFTKAIPILKKYNLPATFYIATDYIDSTFQTWWDIQNNVTTEWMSWDQIRKMHRMGFEIGAHTMTHADLGSIDASSCQKEVLGSFDRIEKEVGYRPKFFSYPYGGKKNLSALNHKVLKQISIPHIAAAYGGLVYQDSTPSFLHRLPIGHWFQTPEQFAFELTQLALKKPKSDDAIPERTSHYSIIPE
jgi:peptidoglycan/xylan/chitin deacetylase (PgdA/CDA1 family)